MQLTGQKLKYILFSYKIALVQFLVEDKIDINTEIMKNNPKFG